ncbi:response regulator transcription factor [Kocuria coralli]|uniref:Response regulator transcription factor n=1 Tax=Kocuria coralli TaxID=1461025 RepID=A0A5J5KVN0_9MICC|nr:response regulator transcription factor [Kocuria coralli]KAA9393767.1 response regulator transcription factor [Kocuria coralli]
MTTVLLADDHAAIRAGVRMILETAPRPVEVVEEAGTAERALELARRLHPDVVLLDIRMPGVSGLSVIGALRRTGAAVIMLTSFAWDEYVLAALEAGADGFLVKSAAPHEIVDAVHRVVSGDAVLSPEVLRAVIDRAVARPPSPAALEDGPPPERSRAAAEAAPGEPPELPAEALTRREEDVLRLLAEGHSNQQIAHRLVVAESTVKTHVSHVLTKLGVASRVQAALWWGRHGRGT